MKEQWFPQLPLLKMEKLGHALAVILKAMIAEDTPDPRCFELTVVLLRTLIRWFYVRGVIDELNAEYLKTVSAIDSRWKVSREYSLHECIQLFVSPDNATAPVILDVFAYYLQKLSDNKCLLKADLHTLLYACADHDFAVGVCLIYDSQGRHADKAHYLKEFILHRHSRKDHTFLGVLGVKDVVSRLLLGSAESDTYSNGVIK